MSDHPSHDELSATLRGDLPAAGTASRKKPSKAKEIESLEGLLARSWAFRFENPSLMVQHARLAAAWADGLDPSRHGVQRVFDLRGRAWAELGNAYRVLDQHDLAEDALSQARYLLFLGSGDERLEIRLLELEASLAADRRRFGYAAILLLKVADFHRGAGDSHRTGRALIKRGLYRGYAGNPEEALRLLPEGLSLVDEEREPSLVYAATHNQLLFIVDCGRFRDAQEFRLRNRQILARDEGRMNRTRLRWVEGRIEAGLRRPDRAEAIFSEVRQEFEELGRSYIASIVALDLAAALLNQQRPEEAKKVVVAAYRVFQALRIEREALAAVITLRTTLETGEATAALAEDVAAFLRRIQHDPNARFEISPW